MSAGQMWESRVSGFGAAGRHGIGPACVTTRLAVLVSSDLELRHRLALGLRALRWTVQEAGGGAEAMELMEHGAPEAIVVDSWLPDLEVGEFAEQMMREWPATDLVRVDGVRADAGRSQTAVRSPRRNELQHAIREAQEAASEAPLTKLQPVALPIRAVSGVRPRFGVVSERAAAPLGGLPEMVGGSAAMMELARLIRLVAPRSATVLIEGETGTGKEVVAKALHRLSARAAKPFVVLNCAAIPESLLEAELFGHTRGAFTGAVTSRTGRIEAAHGGTLFLDEIGEMPLALQAKMLRFLECGELQKVGENETLRVDVRVIAATHQELERRAEEKTFRLDLYHRLAVFPLAVPALRERMDDLPLLTEFFLEQMGREMPRKGLSDDALGLLEEYDWPGNIRELMHVLERAAILAEDRAEIGVGEIRLRSLRRM